METRKITVSPDAVTVKENGGKKSMSMRLFLAVCRMIPIAAGTAAIFYIYVLLSNPKNWDTDPNSTDTEKLEREKSRGAFVSVVMSILLNLIGALMFHIGVKEGLVITNYGFILGPVIGFVLDQGIGSDAGCRNAFTSDGLKYSLSALIGGNFLRYIITVFLDLFISNPLQDVMKRQAKASGIIEMLKETDKKSPRMRKYDHFVALNFPSILQSIVAFITFNAYTNQTRFAWAYPASTLNRDLRIPPGTIMLATAASGVMYLIFYTVMDTFSNREYFEVNTKLLYVLFTLMVLYGLNQTDSVEAPLEGEESSNITESIEDYKPLLGALMLIGFICYGLLYPIWTKVGCICCGDRCRPSQKNMESKDHMMHESKEQQISTKMMDAIVRRMQERRLFKRKPEQKLKKRTKDRSPSLV